MFFACCFSDFYLFFNLCCIFDAIYFTSPTFLILLSLPLSAYTLSQLSLSLGAQMIPRAPSFKILFMGKGCQTVAGWAIPVMLTSSTFAFIF